MRRSMCRNIMRHVHRVCHKPARVHRKINIGPELLFFSEPLLDIRAANVDEVDEEKPTDNRPFKCVVGRRQLGDAKIGGAEERLARKDGVNVNKPEMNGGRQSRDERDNSIGRRAVELNF